MKPNRIISTLLVFTFTATSTPCFENRDCPPRGVQSLLARGLSLFYQLAPQSRLGQVAGIPADPGLSIIYDGHRHATIWVDANGALHIFRPRHRSGTEPPLEYTYEHSIYDKKGRLCEVSWWGDTHNELVILSRRFPEETIEWAEISGPQDIDNLPEVIRPAVRNWFDRSDLGTKWEAISGLGEMGPRMASPPISRLKEILRDEDEDSVIRVGALTTLGKIGLPLKSGEAERYLFVALRSKDKEVRGLARSILDDIRFSHRGRLRYRYPYPSNSPHADLRMRLLYQMTRDKLNATTDALKVATEPSEMGFLIKRFIRGVGTRIAHDHIASLEGAGDAEGLQKIAQGLTALLKDENLGNGVMRKKATRLLNLVTRAREPLLTETLGSREAASSLLAPQSRLAQAEQIEALSGPDEVLYKEICSDINSIVSQVISLEKILRI